MILVLGQEGGMPDPEITDMLEDSVAEIETAYAESRNEKPMGS